MKEIQKVEHQVYFTSIEGRFETLSDLRNYHNIKWEKSVSHLNLYKKYQPLQITKHIIKGSEPLLEYKWHPKFIDYCVDIEGNVFRYSDENGFKYIKPYINTHENLGVNQFNDLGYATIQPFKNKKRSLVYHHRFVAETWIPNPQNYRCVNHINEKKWDNRIENLEWTTYKKNNFHSRKRRNKAIKKRWKEHDYKVNTKQVREWVVYIQGEVVATGPTLKGIAKELGIHNSQLTSIYKRKNSKYGYKFKNWKVEKTYNTIEYTGKYYKSNK